MNASPTDSLPTPRTSSPGWVYLALTGIVALYVTLSCIGITWGLPSRKIDPFLFGEGPVWSGERIFRLAHAGEKLAESRRASTGADVDINPLERPAGPILLTGTEEDIAKIYLRYRLYTYQPDEMITMMALAGMRPGRLQLDPRLYQYGGLFIYPVGALIKLCGLLGLIDVRSDVAWYLDHPDEFGKFYVVARAYSAAWGLLGVLVVFSLTRTLAWSWEGEAPAEPFYARIAGLMAALLFVLLPVVVCMSHEGKPHLPGAVLMLLSVYLAIRDVEENRHPSSNSHKFFWLMCVCCGAAVGMVLSSWPICILIALTAGFRHRASGLRQAVIGLALAVAVYVLTNPYVLIHVFANRQVLRSNFGNSLAMYDVSRIGEGLSRVLSLTIEGAGLMIVLAGLFAGLAGIMYFHGSRTFWLLAMPAALFFSQFVLIGAGKPAEYGRFGIFADSALLIGASVFMTSNGVRRGWALSVLLPAAVIVWTGYIGGEYLRGFARDASQYSSRVAIARDIQNNGRGAGKPLFVVLSAEPAPYVCPPVLFSVQQVWLVKNPFESAPAFDHPAVFLRPWDQSISWADKKFLTTYWYGLP